MRFKFLTLTFSFLTICASTYAEDGFDDDYYLSKQRGADRYAQRHKLIKESYREAREDRDEYLWELDKERSRIAARKAAKKPIVIPEPTFEVAPIRLPIERGKGGKIIKGGKFYEPISIQLILADGQEYNFGRKGGTFTYNPLAMEESNRSPNRVRLVVKDCSLSKSFIVNRTRSQSLRHVRVMFSSKADHPILQIEYDKRSRSFFADCRAPKAWAWGD